MPPGRTTRLKICLTSQELRTLQAWQWANTIQVGRARRGRILLLEDGRTITQIAHTVGISRQCVSKWFARFQAQGLQGLANLPRPAHRRLRAAAGQEES